MTDLWQEFHGANAGYVFELYERFLADPNSVDDSTRTFFATWSPPAEQSSNGHSANGSLSAVSTTSPASDSQKVTAFARLIQSIRLNGHLGAQIDPLGTEPVGDISLTLEEHGLTEADLAKLPANLLSGPIGESSANALDAYNKLKTVYMNKTGYDYEHINDATERNWLRNMAESRHFHPINMELDNIAMLKRLTEVEGFEQFLHRTFVGKKRFSIEGLDMMVPILDEILHNASDHAINHVLMGMAHRGRLNVLTHVLQKPYDQMLAEFKDAVADYSDVNYTGDVKYHAGHKRIIKGKDNKDMLVEIAANPSHLELVNPVVEGMARAAGSTVDKVGETDFDKESVMPILIHGDAAFAGQGIVAETFNFSQLPGWRTGGTIHFIANNQVGFTTDNIQSRSTRYSSDLAKGYRVPIIHVNADDPEACIEVARLVFAYQEKFEKDILINLIGYRRYGHNESDEPRFTQPVMYALVDKNPTVRSKWANTLAERGEISKADADAMFEMQLGVMQKAYESVTKQPSPPKSFKRDKHVYTEIKTAVSAKLLTEYNKELLNFPADLPLHRGLKRVMGRRATALDDPDKQDIDWGHAESLAFASLLAEGTPIRLTGEDVERGTFSHRHAVLRHQETGDRHIPLQVLPQAKAGFEVRNSPLTENAAVGFEYGYSLHSPERLVLWEAQFGDFVNGAQPVIDEYISSGFAKWEQGVSLVMLLPHGYEGQGPDHSTARVDRFLQMAADRNMRIVYPTTAANYFHLLRRQAQIAKTRPTPLIVMAPKSLLRHNLAKSSLNELANGKWQPLIDDASVSRRRKSIKRIALCSGKVFVDAMESEHRQAKPEVALVRIEQLYRFPLHELKALLKKYPNANELVWLQEEPKNGGAWFYVHPVLEMATEGKLPISYIGRPHRASPAEGAMTWHKINQNEIMRQLYDVK